MGEQAGRARPERGAAFLNVLLRKLAKDDEPETGDESSGQAGAGARRADPSSELVDVRLWWRFDRSADTGPDAAPHIDGAERLPPPPRRRTEKSRPAMVVSTVTAGPDGRVEIVVTTDPSIASVICDFGADTAASTLLTGGPSPIPAVIERLHALAVLALGLWTGHPTMVVTGIQRLGLSMAEETVTRLFRVFVPEERSPVVQTVQTALPMERGTHGDIPPRDIPPRPGGSAVDRRPVQRTLGRRPSHPGVGRAL